MQLTKEQIEELERLDKDATSGPWCVGNTRQNHSNPIMFETAIHVGDDATRGNCLARVGLGGEGAINASAEAVEANAQFIAALRNFLPELLRGYRAYLAEVEHHKTACELMAESYAHELAELPTDEESQEIDELYHYHRNRLLALKGEG